MCKLSVNDKPYGNKAKQIYEELVNKCGFNPDKKNQFGMLKPLFAQEAAKDKENDYSMSVWFLCHYTWFGKLGKKVFGKMKPEPAVINEIKDNGDQLILIETFDLTKNKNPIDETHNDRVTFYKDKNGYQFLGIMKITSVEEVEVDKDKKRIVKYQRISTEYPKN